MALLPTEEYVESGYLAADDYVGGIADAEIILEPYVVEDYIEAGYFQEPGILFSIEINTDGVVQEASASLSVVATSSITGGKLHSGVATITDAFNTTMSATAKLAGDATMETYSSIEIVANRTRSGESSLEWFADLDAQAARFRDTGADFSSLFWMSDSSHNFGTNVDVDATFEGASILTSAASVVAEGLNVQFGDADLSSSVDTTASAIEYISRFTNSDRPYTMQVYDATNTQVTAPASGKWGYSTSLKVYNSYSVNVIGTDYTMRLDKTVDFGSDDFAIEWWQYTAGGFSTGDFLFRMVYTDSLGQGEIIDLRYYDDGNSYLRLGAREDTDTGSSNNDTGDLGSDLPGWHHYAIVKDSNGISLVLDGTVEVSRSFTSTGITANSASLQWYAENKSPYFDGMHIQAGSSTANSYSAQPTETEHTIGIWDFETTMSGGAGGALTFEGSAQANTVANTTATLSGVQNASATLASEGFVVTAVGRISDFFVNADITSTVVASPEKTVSFDSTMVCAATVGVAEDLFKGFGADLPGVFTISNLVGAIRQGSSSSGMVMNVDVAPGYVAESSVALASAADMSVEGGTVKSAFASMACAFAVSANGGITAEGSATVGGVFDQTSTETRIRVAETEFDSVASTSTVGNYTGDALLSAGWVADLTATPESFPAGSALLEAVFGFSVLTTSTAPAEAQLPVVSSIAVEGTKTTRFTADLSSAFELNTVTTSTAPAAADLTSAFTIEVQEQLFKANSVQMSVVSGVSVSGSRTRAVDGALEVTATATVTPAAVYEASANFTAFYSTLNIAKVLHIEQFVYTVPRETRVYLIQQETREHSITQETRTYSIEGA